MANEKTPNTGKTHEGVPTIEVLDDAPNKSKLMRGLGCVAAVAAAGSLVMGAHFIDKAMNALDSSESVESVGVNAESVEVREVNRELVEIHSVAFTSEVNGVRVEHRLTERKGAGFIPLPDIITSVEIDEMYIDSTLGLDAGSKQMTQWEEDGVSYVEYVIDPADVKVYSKESASRGSLSADGGNWVTKVKKGLDGIESALPFGDTDPEGQRLSSQLGHAARHIAIDAVNRECGPKVFEATKDDFLQNIEDTLRRDDDEEIIVKFPDDIAATDIAISGESNIEDPLIALKDSSEPDETVILNTEVGAAKECVMPTEVSRWRH